MPTTQKARAKTKLAYTDLGFTVKRGDLIPDTVSAERVKAAVEMGLAEYVTDESKKPSAPAATPAPTKES